MVDITVRLVIGAALLLACGCGKHPPLATANDCKTEPNGDKIWYPDMYPFYQEGSRVISETWPLICKAGKWETDKQALLEHEEQDRPRQDLLQALRTRVLTQKELVMVNNYGSRLLIQGDVPYRQLEIDMEFAALLKVQELMRLAAVVKGKPR